MTAAPASVPLVATLPSGEVPSDAILEALPVAVLVIGADNAIRFANAATERMLGQSADGLARLKLGDLVSADSPLLALLDVARERGLSVSERDIALHKTAAPMNGEALKSHVQLLPLRQEAGLLSDVLLLLHDASAADEIDRQLAANVSARAASGMAAVLAHEVKNPLSGIRGAAQLLAQGAPEQDRRLTELICEETDRIRELVNRMESLNDPQAGSVEAVNVHEVLDHVIALTEAGFGVGLELSRQYDPSLPPVAAEHGRLVQVMLNIIKNAAEAAPRHSGRIEITTRYRQGVRISLPGVDHPIEAPIEISISDNGPGIAENVRNMLFNPFVTTKTGGTGLGLALVQKLVTEIGGSVDCESGATGATFRLYLPTWKEEQA